MSLETCIFLTAWVALLASALQAKSLATAKSYKLEIHYARDTSGNNYCNFLAIANSQYHKGLHDTNIIQEDSLPMFNVKKGFAASVDTFINVYSTDVNLLWHRAKILCGPSSLWSFPTYLSPDLAISLSEKVTATTVQPQMPFATSYTNHQIAPPPLEVVPLIKTGPPSNRVDITFFGDGYTEDERGKFIEDARALATDISDKQTFHTVKPLLNFWAAFSASNERGLGVGGKPKDTVFGLYRDGTELRAVYYDKPEVASAACSSLGDACDYAILLGNDPLYGGLGGRFTVTTSSKINGPLVLRHELGHSIIKEGEEYDGGFAYYGSNAAQNLSDPFPWSHWLSAKDISVPRAERSVMPLQAYPWTMLSPSASWSITFNSSGLYSHYLIRFSLSGIPEKSHLTVKLDDEDLKWTPEPGIGVDRWHYDIHRDFRLEAGTHNVSFSLDDSAMVGLAQLCSVEVLEYGDSEEFNTADGFIGAFPTFSEQNETTYRPTNEGCLMRVVTSPDFCKVCTEGLWHVLLERVNLIDNVSTDCVSQPLFSSSKNATYRTLAVGLVGLGQFRSARRDVLDPVDGEFLSISWKKNGVALKEFDNKRSIRVDGDSTGKFIAEVRLSTREVRVDPHGYMTDTASIEVLERCEGDA